VPDSEGAGRQRGGVGLTRCFRLLGERAKVTLSTDRMRIEPWGVAGGRPARGARCTITRANGEVMALGSKVTTFVTRGERLRVVTPGGGGWGEPRERDAEAVRRDVEEGLVSPARACEVYGVETEQEQSAELFVAQRRPAWTHRIK
jgi:N-methylhydantoinase B